MGKWDLRADFKTVRGYLLCLIIFVVAVITSGRIANVGSVSVVDGTVLIRSNLYFCFLFLVSLFVFVTSTALFYETYRKPALAYLRTLPLSVWQTWVLRRAAYVLVLCVIILPAVWAGVQQVTEGANNFITIFHYDMPELTIDARPILIRCALSINFYFLLTQLFLILSKSRIMTCLLLFVYCIAETEPLKGILGEYALFYGSFSPMPINVWWTHNLTCIAIGTVILEALTTAWYIRNFRTRQR